MRRALAVKCCHCRHLAKYFPRFLRTDLQVLAVPEKGETGKEKVLGFPELSVFQVIGGYGREASKILSP